ncbi:MAG: hypothetical protein LC643_04995, partial [Bacteroidales bacterium]|nr:hypothetical protein [Bacteroidales bacterium]
SIVSLTDQLFQNFNILVKGHCFSNVKRLCDYIWIYHTHRVIRIRLQGFDELPVFPFCNLFTHTYGIDMNLFTLVLNCSGLLG